MVDRLGNTLFALMPDYDATAAMLGGDPPLGVPQECTFEWAWELAEQTVARQNRATEVQAQRDKVTAQEQVAARKAARKAVPRKVVRKAPRKSPPAGTP